ncbi:TPA: hypothetical protein ACWWFG_002837 [Enterococcus faecalis]
MNRGVFEEIFGETLKA